jgi:hypothetical protein
MVVIAPIAMKLTISQYTFVDRRLLYQIFLQMNVEERMHCVQKPSPPHFYLCSQTKHQNETKHSSQCTLCFHIPMYCSSSSI